MALLADRVKETTTTTGTGTVSLAGAPAGFQSFNTAFANGSLVYYVIQGGAEWEIGIGTTGTGTLARTQVLQSSNADALVPFSAGVKDVFCSYVADRAVTTVDAATLTNKTLDDYTNDIGANSTHFRIKATGTISKGSVVKATGYNPGEQAIEVAVVTSATDLVLGISEQALTTGQFGLAVVIGELFNVNTNGFTVGNILYSNGAGGFTETKPSSGLYQALGWVVRANTSNGVIAVNVVAPLYVETATNTANTSVLRDGSGNFAAGTITATLSGTATQVSNALTAGTYLTSGGTYNGSAARTFAVDATDANTASKVVARDGSGNFSAGTITANLSGTATQVSQALTAGSYLTSTGTYNGGTARTFAVDATDANTASKVVARDASGNFSAGTITANLTGNISGSAPAGSLTGSTLASNVVSSSLTSVGTLANLTVTNPISGSVTGSSGSTTGNAATATALQTARTINGVSFNGTADITVTAAAGTLTGTTLASGVTASSLTSVGTLSGLTTSGNITVNASNGTVQVITPTADQPQIRMRMSGTDGILDVTRNSGTAPNLIFGTEGAEAGRFDANRNFIVDTNTLFVDAVNNRVGVGTASPSYTVDVVGSSSTALNLAAFSNTSSANNTTKTVSAVFRLADTVGAGKDVAYITAFPEGANVLTGGLAFSTRTGDANPTEKLRLDGPGNLGLGVTPSAWNSAHRALQFGSVGAVSTNGTFVRLYNNGFTNSAGNEIYVANGFATLYNQVNGAHQWYTAPSGTAGNAITFTQAMTLDASGNVSVGGTAGGNRLRVTSADNSGVTTIAKFESNNGNQATLIRFASVLGENGDFTTGTSTNHNYILSSNNTERARITSGGYTKHSNDGTYFDATGAYHEFRQTANNMGLRLTSTVAGFTSMLVYGNTSTAAGTGFDMLNFEANGVGQFRVRGDGTIFAQNTTVQSISDARLKENVVSSMQGLDVITALRPVRYDWKAGHGNDRKNQLGFIAQEVEPVFADAVSEWDMDGETYKTVGPAALIPVLVKAIQELDTRLKALEN